MNLLLASVAFLVGVVFVTGFASVFRKAVANGLMVADQAAQFVAAVRLCGVLLIGAGLVATVYNLAAMQ